MALPLTNESQLIKAPLLFPQVETSGMRFWQPLRRFHKTEGQSSEPATSWLAHLCTGSPSSFFTLLSCPEITAQIEYLLQGTCLNSAFALSALSAPHPADLPWVPTILCPGWGRRRLEHLSGCGQWSEGGAFRRGQPLPQSNPSRSKQSSLALI